MTSFPFRLAVDHPSVATVAALWQPSDGERPAVLLAHGSGSALDSPFQTAIAEGLVARGFPVLRFQYPYRERALAEGRARFPDPAPVLEATHERALDALRERAPGRRVLLAGKSLGARIGTHLAAKNVPCAGLILFGYPLHPAKQPAKLRREHFPAIVQPALFLTGTRDALAELELLRSSLRTFGGKATLHVVDDADHSFHVRKSSGRDDAAVLVELLDAVDRWERVS
ncbi:MAG: alpha/beta family hydrolase [Planctomycetota bacterium]